MEIREQVFVRELEIPRTLEWDGKDARAVHLVAESHLGLPIGTARMLASGQIGRMAVLAQWRGRGVGYRLLQTLLEIAKEEAYPNPWLNAQASALAFYEKAGFTRSGNEYLEANIPHVKLRYQPVKQL